MARKEKKYHYIYKITCNVTNRYYIGMHSTDNLNDGYFGSGKRLWFSLNYHGKKNHTKEILEFLPTRDELKRREKEIVNSELIKEDLCMNLVVGGEGGGFVDDEHLKRFQIAGSKAGNNKIKELREKDDIWYENLVLRRTKTLIENFANGKIKKQYGNKSNTGKTFSKEHKQKIGKTNSIKQAGKKNSQYGTCWITRDGFNKKIKIEDLNSYVNDGWVKGRDRAKEIWKTNKTLAVA